MHERMAWSRTSAEKRPAAKRSRCDEKPFGRAAARTAQRPYGNWGNEKALLMKTAIAPRVTGFSGQ